MSCVDKKGRVPAGRCKGMDWGELESVCVCVCVLCVCVYVCCVVCVCGGGGVGLRECERGLLRGCGDRAWCYYHDRHLPAGR